MIDEFSTTEKQKTEYIKMVDISILIIVMLSALVGFMRGVTREALGFISWVGAFFIAIYALPLGRPFLTPYITSSFLVDLIGGVGIFLISLIILNIFTKFLSSQVRESILSGIDRSLGLVFGICRGVIVVALLYLTLTFFLNPVSWPEYLKEARLVGITREVAEYLVALIPETELPATIKEHFAKSLDSRSSQDVLKDIQTLSILTPIQEETTPQHTIPAS